MTISNQGTQGRSKPTQSQIGTRWLEELASAEIHMDETGVVELNDHLDHQQILDESATDMLKTLKSFFEQGIRTFNRLRGAEAGSNSIKLYHVSNTPADFMLFRNALKLVVSTPKVGVIRLAFTSHTGGVFAARLDSVSPPEAGGHEMMGQVGPFNEVVWTVKGQKVNPSFLVKHYLTEFIKNSAR